MSIIRHTHALTHANTHIHTHIMHTHIYVRMCVCVCVWVCVCWHHSSISFSGLKFSEKCPDTFPEITSTRDIRILSPGTPFHKHFKAPRHSA